VTVALVHFLAALALAGAAVPVLLRARWPWRCPLTATLTWQLVALTVPLSLIGVLVALGTAPFDNTALLAAVFELVAGRAPDGFTIGHAALLLAAAALAAAPLLAVASAAASALATRRRHRELLALVARAEPGLPGVLVLDHPDPTAYCVPGRPPRLVVSTGALRALDRAELTAVLAHERAHARERHHLALLPFAALRRLVPRWQAPTSVFDAVALLLEMRADDVARRTQSADALATALHRFRRPGGPVPPGTLAMAHRTGDRAGTEVAARLDRITGRHSGLPAAVRLLVLAAGATVAATPVSFFLP
jgi:bla regulator protein blaR1